MPGKVDGAVAVHGVELDGEAVVIAVQAHVGVHRRDRPPVGVADRDVDASQHRAVAQADVAQVAAFEREREWTRAQQALLDRRLIATIAFDGRREKRRAHAGPISCGLYIDT